MKKTGFTLAEVLITLAIIGVVATMTLPALMTNTQEQQAKTGLKKGLNTLTEAAQMNLATDGFDYAGITAASNAVSSAEGQQSMTGLLVARTQVDYQASNNGGGTSDAGNVDATATNYVVFFRDGSSVSFPNAAPAPTTKVLQADGLPLGFGVIYDYNGAKRPNLMSNCAGNTAMSGANKTDAANKGACTKANRVIRDQFSVRLRGGFAYPNGAAANWAYEN